LLIGIELDRRARPFCEALAKRGVLCKETHDMVLRIAPPLVVRAADLDWAVEAVRRGLGWLGATGPVIPQQALHFLLVAKSP
jgi:acetylornithine/succinyldiaminopimelate/putrescine aminotransferase